MSGPRPFRCQSPAPKQDHRAVCCARQNLGKRRIVIVIAFVILGPVGPVNPDQWRSGGAGVGDASKALHLEPKIEPRKRRARM